MFDIRAESDAETAIYLYDEIGYYGVSAKRFQEVLMSVSTENIRLHINSPGGDVFDGIAIYNALIAWEGNITVSIDGLAASAASLIAMAGDRIEIADSAFVMIHNAWTIALGSSADFAEIAKTLGKIDASLARVYADRTGIDLADIKSMMDDTTWLDSGDAVERGFADAVVPLPNSAEAQASFDVSNFRNAPRAVVNRHGSCLPRVSHRPAKDDSAAKLLAALNALTRTIRTKTNG